MRYTVVTTFNAAGYENYARRMIQTWLATWPSTVELWAYAENCAVAERATNLRVFDLHQTSPELVRFKTQWANVPKANGDVSADPIRSQRRDAGKGFKWDAVRFSHKVYSIFHAAQHTDSDWLIWMDADMVCHSPVSLQFLDQQCSAELCFLGRKGKFSECGLYAMDLRSSKIRQWLAHFQYMYDNAEKGIFRLDEWHDSFVFDAVRRAVPVHECDWSSHIITGEGHPLINSAWGSCLDHLKGARKKQGRSAAADLKVPRMETYWQ